MISLVQGTNMIASSFVLRLSGAGETQKLQDAVFQQKIFPLLDREVLQIVPFNLKPKLTLCMSRMQPNSFLFCHHVFKAQLKTALKVSKDCSRTDQGCLVTSNITKIINLYICCSILNRSARCWSKPTYSPTSQRRKGGWQSVSQVKIMFFILFVVSATFVFNHYPLLVNLCDLCTEQDGMQAPTYALCHRVHLCEFRNLWRSHLRILLVVILRVWKPNIESDIEKSKNQVHLLFIELEILVWFYDSSAKT